MTLRFAFVCLCFTALLQCSFVLFAQEFTQFRGASGGGRVNDQKIPSQWSEEKNLAWKIEVPGAGWPQPILWDERLFVTTAVSEPELKPKDFAGGVRMPQSMGAGGATPAPDVHIQWQVFCYDAESGSLLWSQTVCEGKPQFPIHPSKRLRPVPF